MKTYCVYILTNRRNTTFYVGVTNNLERRIYEHKNKLLKGFTSKYNINKLVWYEGSESVSAAITAEKTIKGWVRKKKIDLIKKTNPDFKDLTK